jgi:tetratricopeptide (TPR) repeat protein
MKIQKNILFVTIIGIAVILAYFPAFKAGFTNWDDPAYITSNEVVRNFDADQFSDAFSTFRNGHYHPLTWLSLAADYAIGNGSPAPFHATNILIHLLNSLLLFILFARLTGNRTLSLATALLFGIHPMGVEAVAWISERKTVLYVLFFIISLIYYLKFTNTKKSIHYLLSVLFFVLSCLSKSMALVLPAILVMIDYYQGKSPFSIKTYINKIPFLAISFITGLLSVWAQQAVMQQGHLKEFTYSMGWGAWSFLLYLIKMIVPYPLSAFYPYPPDASLDTIRVIAGITVMALFLLLIVYFYRKNNRILVFALLFVLVNIFFVLKFFNIPVSAYYMADRYAYLPAAGLWLAVLSFAFPFFRNQLLLVRYIIPAIVIVFVILSHQRSGIWKNSITLWTDVIDKQENATIAYINRGNAYREKKQYSLAIRDYTEAERINPLYPALYSNRGYAYYMNGQYQEAVRDYTLGIGMGNREPEMLFSRGLARQKLNDMKGAIEDFENTLKADSLFTGAYNAMGNTYLDSGNDSLAIIYYTRAIRQTPGNAESLYNRANILAKKGLYKEAISDYNKAIEIAGYQSDYLVNRASTWYYLNEFEKAMEDFNTVISSNPKHTNARLNRGTLCLRMGKYQIAFDDFSEIISREPGNAEAWLKRGMTILNSHKPSDACRDFEEADKLGHPLAKTFLASYCKN